MSRKSPPCRLTNEIMHGLCPPRSKERICPSLAASSRTPSRFSCHPPIALLLEQIVPQTQTGFYLYRLTFSSPSFFPFFSLFFFFSPPATFTQAVPLPVTRLPPDRHSLILSCLSFPPFSHLSYIHLPDVWFGTRPAVTIPVFIVRVPTLLTTLLTTTFIPPNQPSASFPDSTGLDNWSPLQPPTTFKIHSFLLPRTTPPSAGAMADSNHAGRRRRSSSLIYKEPPETIEQRSDQAALPNLNASWVNSKGGRSISALGRLLGGKGS